MQQMTPSMRLWELEHERTIAETIEEGIAAGLGFPEIAAQMGVSYAVLYAWRLRLGIEFERVIRFPEKMVG